MTVLALFVLYDTVRLQKLQNRAARVLTFSRYDADANRLFRQLNWQDMSAHIYFCSSWLLACIFFLTKRNWCYGGQLENRMVRLAFILKLSY